MIEVNDYDAVLYTFYNGASSMQNLCIWPKSLMLGENDMFFLGIDNVQDNVQDNVCKALELIKVVKNKSHLLFDR